MRNNPGKSDSLGYFNLARGIGMLLIVLGHTVALYILTLDTAYPVGGAGSILSGGIIAAFFMISGFGFYKRSMKKCLSIQTKLLLKPYCLTAAAILGTKVLLSLIKQRPFMDHGGELVLTYLLGLNATGGSSVFGIPIESVASLWFILALFGGWIIYNAIMQIKSNPLQCCLITGCVIISYLMTLVSKVWPFCLPMALMAAGYLAAGDYIRRNQLLERKLPFWCWGMMLIILSLSAAFGEVDIADCVWRLGLIDVAGTFCAGFLLLRLYACFMKRQWKGKLLGLLEEIGLKSIWIVCLHAYEKYIFPWYRVCAGFSDQPWLGVFLCFVCRCAVIYLLYWIISRVIRKWKKKHRKKKITIEL